MFFVKPNVVGEGGHTPIDPDRRECLPAGVWRAVPENPYWLRLQQMGDVALRRAEDPPPVKEMEGYEPPAKPDPEPADAKSSKKGE